MTPGAGVPPGASTARDGAPATPPDASTARRGAPTARGDASTARRARPPVALYVHVPFCRSLCPYCDFVVYAGADAVGSRSRVGAFLVALLRELGLRADAVDDRFGPPGEAERPPLATLYLGGGTPSLLSSDAVAELVAMVRERFGLADGAEVTIEANPGPDDRGDLAGLARAGVTRVSVGAQSFDDAELRSLGRGHHATDVADAVAAAREGGIGRVSLDLLYDVPGQRLATWAASLEAALALRPDHVSCYALTLDDPDADGLTGPLGDHLPTTAGARRWRDRARSRQDEDRAAGAYALADAMLEGAGMPWYEISNWALPGAESRHNLAYWQRLPYEAIGPGAHAFDGANRRWNAAALGPWLAALAPAEGAGAAVGRAELPPGGAEEIDAGTAASEAVILGLRTAAGIPRAEALTRPDAIAWATEAGLVEDGPGDRVRLTLRGRLLSNELFARLL